MTWPPAPRPEAASDGSALLGGVRLTRDAWASMVAARPGTRYRSFEAFYLHGYPLRTDALNEVRVTGPNPDPREVLSRAREFFPEVDARWRLICPPSWGEDLGAPCRAAGLVEARPEAVLVLGAERFQPPAGSPEVRCRRVEDPDDLRTFSSVFARAGEVPETDFWADPAILRTAGWDLFLGFREGVPVATGVGFTSAGVTGLWGVATVREARGHGVGSRITAAVVTAGHRRGARTSFLWSTELGFGVYRRLGFEHVQNQPVWTFGVRPRADGRESPR